MNDVWTGLPEDRRRAILGALQSRVNKRAVAERDLYASNFGEDPAIEVYACRRDGDRLTVLFIVDWWEWCPAQSGSDWSYHKIFRGTAVFENNKLASCDLASVRETYIHEYDEKNHDRAAALQAVREELERETDR